MSDKNLWQRISAVMQDVQYLQKDDKVGFGNSSYKAISEEKVTESLRASLIKNGLVILPVEQEHSRDDLVLKDKDGNDKVNRLSTVNTKYKIINIDNPAEFEYLVSSGTGVDTQDKGVGKAMTYSYKYMLLRTFAIPTGEDPDKVSSEEWDSKNSGNKVPVDLKNDKRTQSIYISEAEAKNLFTVAKKDTALVKKTIGKYNYIETKSIKKADYEKIVNEIQAALPKAQ